MEMGLVSKNAVELILTSDEAKLRPKAWLTLVFFERGAVEASCVFGGLPLSGLNRATIPGWISFDSCAAYGSQVSR
jgi:hypothetical protein